MCLSRLISNLIFKSHAWLHDVKKMQVVLKNASENLILTEKRKRTTSIAFIECFLKRDVCAT